MISLPLSSVESQCQWDVSFGSYSKGILESEFPALLSPSHPSETGNTSNVTLWLFFYVGTDKKNVK